MHKMKLGLLFGSALMVTVATHPAVARACPDAEAKEAPAKATVAKMGVDELDQALRTGKAIAIDVNSSKVRESEGVIKGAKLLSHYSEFKAAELPAAKDAKLVFYCYNHSCGASSEAAKRALTLGYTQVAILPAGIKGWKSAGKAVQ